MSGRSLRTLPPDQAALFQHLGLLRAELHARELREDLALAPIEGAMAYSQFLGRIDQLRDDRILRLSDALSGVPEDEAAVLTQKLTCAATAHPLRDDAQREDLPPTWRSAFCAITGRPALAILTIGETSLDDDPYAVSLRADLLIECALRAVHAKDPKLALRYADRAEACLSRFPKEDWALPTDLSVNLQEARALAYLARKEIGDEERARHIFLRACLHTSFERCTGQLQLRLRRAVGRCLLEIPRTSRSHENSRVLAIQCMEVWTAVLSEVERCTEDLVCASNAHIDLARHYREPSEKRQPNLKARRHYDLACTLAERAFRGAPASLHAAQRLVDSLTEGVRVGLDATSSDALVDRVREIWNTCVANTGAKDPARLELASDQREPNYFAWMVVGMRSRLDKIFDQLGSTLRICAEVRSRHPQSLRAQGIRLSALYLLSKVHDRLPGPRAHLLARRYRKAAVQIAEKWVNRHPEQKDSFEDLLYAYAHQAEPHEVTGMPSSDPEAGRAAVLARSGWRHIVSSCSESELPPSLSGALPPPRECLARCRRMVAERPNDYQVLMCLERIIYLWQEYRNRRKAKRSSNHHRRIHQHLLELHRKARTAYASEWHGSLETTRVLAYSLWSACRSTHANDDLSLRLRFVADLEHVLLLESRLATIAAASGEDFDSHLRTVIRFHDNLHQGDSTPPTLKTAFSRSKTTAERLQEWAASFAEALSHDEASMHALKSILDIIGLDANNTETTSRFLTVSLRFLQQQTRTTSDRPDATEGAAEVPDFMMAVASHCAANRSRAYAQSLQEVVLGILVAGVGDRRELRPPDPLLSAALSSLRILMEAGALDLKNLDHLLPLVQSLATDESWTSGIRITATRIIGNLLPVLEPNQATEVRSWMIRALEQAYAGEPPASDHNSWQSPIGRQCEQDRNYILAERKYRLPGFEERVSAIRQRRIEILERELENSNSALDSDEKERRTEDIQSWLSTFLRELAAELREQGTSQGHASAMAIEKRRLDLLKYAGRRIDRLLAKRTDEYQSTVHQILMDLRQCAIPMGSPEVYAYACKGAAALDRLRLSHPRWFRRMMGDLLWFHWMAAASAVSADRPDAPKRLDLLRDACRTAASDATYQGEGPNAQEYIGRIEAWLLNVTCSNSEKAE